MRRSSRLAEGSPCGGCDQVLGQRTVSSRAEGCRSLTCWQFLVDFIPVLTVALGATTSWGLSILLARMAASKLIAIEAWHLVAKGRWHATEAWICALPALETVFQVSGVAHYRGSCFHHQRGTWSRINRVPHLSSIEGREDAASLVESLPDPPLVKFLLVAIHGL